MGVELARPPACPPAARRPPAGLCVSLTQIYRAATQLVCLSHRYIGLQHSLCVSHTEIQAKITPEFSIFFQFFFGPQNVLKLCPRAPGGPGGHFWVIFGLFWGPGGPWGGIFFFGPWGPIFPILGSCAVGSTSGAIYTGGTELLPFELWRSFCRLM